MNHFLQTGLVDAQWAAIQASTTPSPFTDSILLNQSVLAGVPPVGYSLLYADPSDRLNVTSQSFPNQQVAYLSDIPAPAPQDSIQDALGTTKVLCSPGNIAGYLPPTGLTPMFQVGSPPDVSLLSNGTGPLSSCSLVVAEDNVSLVKNNQQRIAVKSTDELVLNDQTGVERVIVSTAGVSINGNYNLPPTDGTIGQVIITDGSGNPNWADIPISDRIRAADLDSNMVCGSGGVSVIYNSSVGLSVFSSSIGGGSTGIYSPTQTAFVVCNDTGSVDLRAPGDISLGFPGLLKVNAYSIPGTLGTERQVLMSDGVTTSSWQTLPGIYSQVIASSATNTAAETTLVTSGAGTFGYGPWPMQTGDTSTLHASGVFRNRNALQTIRFKVYCAANVLWDSGFFTMPSVNTVRPWNLSITITFTGGFLVANGEFTYRSTATGMSGFGTQTSLVAGPTIPTNLNLTVQWGAANINNTLTCNQLSLSRVY